MAAEKPHAKAAGRPAHPEGSILSNMTSNTKLKAVSKAIGLAEKATAEENSAAIAKHYNLKKSAIRIFFEPTKEDEPKYSKILLKQATGPIKGVPLFDNTTANFRARAEESMVTVVGAGEGGGGEGISQLTSPGQKSPPRTPSPVDIAAAAKELAATAIDLAKTTVQTRHTQEIKKKIKDLAPK